MSWIAYAAAAAAVLFWLAYNPIAWFRLRKVPSPRRLPFLGHLLSIQSKTLHGFHFESFRQCGPIFTLWWARKPYVVLCDPATCRKVLQRFSFRTLMPAPFRTGKDRQFYTEGLVFAKDMAHHKIVRAAWQPHFNPASLAAYHPLMSAATRRLVAHVGPLAQAGQPLDIHRLVGYMSMEVVGRAAFGIDINAYPPSSAAAPMPSAKGAGKAGIPLVSVDVSAGAAAPAAPAGTLDNGGRALGREVVDAMALVMHNARPENASAWMALYVMLPEAVGQAVAALAKLLPDKSWRQLIAAQDSLWDVALTLIRSRGGGDAVGATALAGQAAPSSNAAVDAGSFIQHLLTTRARATGAAMTEDALVSNVVTFIAAGYDTSANAIACALYHIAMHPEVEAKLLQEIDAFGPADAVPEQDHLLGFPYLAAVIDETLRLTPVAAYIFREASEPINLHGYDIPAGTTFHISVWAAHHDPDVWRDVERFVPDRFLPGKNEWSAPEGAAMPFGGGLRHCIGSKFALQEIKLALVGLYQQFTFRLAPGYPALHLQTGITTGPRDPVMVTAHARHVSK